MHMPPRLCLADLHSPSRTVQADLLIVACDRELLSRGESALILALPSDAPHLRLSRGRADTRALPNIPQFDELVCAPGRQQTRDLYPRTYAEASNLPSGLAAVASTQLWCPCRIATAPSPRAPLSSPARTSCSTIRASSLPEYSHWLSGLHDRVRTHIACAAYVANTVEVSASATTTCPVSVPTASCLPSGDWRQLTTS